MIIHRNVTGNCLKIFWDHRFDFGIHTHICLLDPSLMLCCFQELQEHVKLLEKRFGKYVFAQPRTLYNPDKLEHHLAMTIPGYKNPNPKPSPGESKWMTVLNCSRVFIWIRSRCVRCKATDSIVPSKRFNKGTFWTCCF